MSRSKGAGFPGRRSDSSRKQRAWTISDLLNEACRVPEASKHVGTPQEPEWILGSRDSVENRAFEYHAQAKKSDGKSRLQCTSPAMNAIVVSLERELIDAWPAYCERSLAYHVEELGDRVLGAVIHDDEAHPHMHVFAVPLDGEEFGVVHPGYGASRSLRRTTPKDTPKIGTLIRVAYTEAMVEWQDRFHVGTRIPSLRLERTGPRRARMDRAVYKIYSEATDQAEATAKETVKNAKAAAEAIVEAARAKAAEMSSLAEEFMDASRAIKIEADDAKAQAAVSAARNVASAKVVAAERAKLEMTSTGELAARIAKMETELESERSAHAATARLLDDMRFRAKVIEDKTRIASVTVETDPGGVQAVSSDAFDKGTGRATMRPRKPAPA